jgi:hypothetical protein
MKAVEVEGREGQHREAELTYCNKGEGEYM